MSFNLKYKLYGTSTIIHVIRHFSVAKMIKPGGENADIAVLKVDGEIDIRYFYSS